MAGGVVLVRAVLNPAREDAALQMLSRLGVTGVSVQDAVGVDWDAVQQAHGPEHGQREEEGFARRERIIVEFSVAEDMSEEVLAALMSAVRTGRKDNDGKIFLLRPKKGGG